MASTTLRKAALIALAASVIALTALDGTVALSAPRAALGRSGMDGPLVRLLEHRFARAEVADWAGVTGLIVAGGSPTRTREAIRLAELHPHLRIVLSGPAEIEIACVQEAVRISADRIHIDRRPQNTYENALWSKALVAPRADERWLLVTSASHMPRAIGSFSAVGFHVKAWPVTEGAPGDASHVAAHEWLGLVAYWLRGRTIALFPGESDVSGAREARDQRLGLTHRG